jgi:CRISPR-associated endonuclease/helicase Cas3
VIVGRVARALASYLPSSLQAALQVEVGLTAALHDVGKVSPGFQLKYFQDHVLRILPELAAPACTDFESNHARTSEASICNRLSLGSQDDPLAGFARIAGFHHGRRESAFLTDTGEVFGGLVWSNERQRLIQALESEFGALAVSALPAWQLDLLAGLVCVADWIGSDESHFPPEGLPPGADVKTLAMQAVAGCGWKHFATCHGLSFRDVFGCAAYPLQQDFIDHVDGPGLYILEAPMGMGKTEAALFAAYKILDSGQATGLYFGLPTRLTSDKMHERVASFLEKICDATQPVRLAHGTAWLEDYGFAEIKVDDSDKTTWFHPHKRALLYPFAVGTIDQALLGIIRVKHFFVRQFGLAGKVVILDEVHSYDRYTGTLLDRLVQRLLDLKCTVIILSATLTAERRQRLLAAASAPAVPQAYPLVTARTQIGTRMAEPIPPKTRVIHVGFENWQPTRVAKEAVQRAERGQCVICIANTVAQAQQWHNHIKGAMKQDAFDVGLLHSKFLGWRRDQLEKTWINKLGKDGERPKGCILVATQVVEQSVDIDADYMITELAPSDMLLQRIGRLWRHERPARPAEKAQVMIVTGDVNASRTQIALIEALGKTNCLVYASYVLWRTHQAWHQRTTIRIPDDVRTLLEDTYAAICDEPDYVVGLKEKLDTRCEKLIRLALFAQSSVQGAPEMSDKENAHTRYSDQLVTDVLLVKNVDSVENAATIEMLDEIGPVRVNAFYRDMSTLKRLYRNLVSIATHQLLKAGVKIATPLYLRKYFFDATVVLTVGPDGRLAFEGRPLPFRYDSDRGLQRTENPCTRPYQERLETEDDAESYPYSDYDDLEDLTDEFDW